MFQPTAVMKRHRKSLHALASVIALASLSACGGGGTTPSSASNGSGGTGSTGGGGTTVTASPYIAFASSYLAYPTTGAPNYGSTQADGSYLTSIQHGDVITGFGGNYTYGGFSSDQHDMNFMRGYRLQVTDKGVAPTTASDYVYAAFLAPGSNGTNVGTVDISQATTLVIEMGNTFRPAYTVNTFTIDLNDAHGTTAATNDCAYDQVLNDGSATGLSQDGFFTYAIPLSSFTCTKGSVASLTALTTVAVKILGNKNTGVAVGNYNILSVGSIGFTSALPTGTNTTPVSAALAL